MSASALKSILSILFIANGVLHLVVATLVAPAALKIPLTVFGALYAGFGVTIRRGGRAIILAALGASLIGLVLGGLNYLRNGGPEALLAMFAIDIAGLVVGGLWLSKAGKD